MPDEILFPFLAVAAGVGLLIMAGWYFTTVVLARRRRALKRRITGPEDSEHTLLLEDQLARQRRGAAGRLDARFNLMIERTGMDLEPGLALAIMMLVGMALAAGVFVWRYEEDAWLAIPSFFLGAGVVYLFYLYRQSVWKRTLQDQLPDALFLLARSVRAGRSVDQSFQLISDQGVPPLSKEFGRMSRQLELGLPLNQVLEIESQRLELVDFNVFASVLALHRTTGGSLPVILDRIAASTRDRNQFDKQYRASTAMARHAVKVVVAVTAIIFIYLFFFQREMAMRYFDFSQGYFGLYLFLTALGLQLTGALWMYWYFRHGY